MGARHTRMTLPLWQLRVAPALQPGWQPGVTVRASETGVRAPSHFHKRTQSYGVR